MGRTTGISKVDKAKCPEEYWIILKRITDSRTIRPDPELRYLEDYDL